MLVNRRNIVSYLIWTYNFDIIKTRTILWFEDWLDKITQKMYFSIEVKLSAILPPPSPKTKTYFCQIEKTVVKWIPEEANYLRPSNKTSHSVEAFVPAAAGVIFSRYAV